MLNAVIAKFLRHLLLAWLLALPALAAQAAAPGVDPALLTPLAGDDTDARLQAIAALGQQPGPGAAAVLQALGNDQLYALPDGRVLIGDGKGQATDPATGATLAMPAEASGIGINNRLRRAIEAALAGSRLFSDNPQERLAAARRLQQTGDPARLPLLEKALAAEKDAAVRAALEIAQANLELKSADPAVRRHAVDLLGRTDNAAFRPTLAALTQQQDGVYAEPDAGVREAAANALKRIDRHLATIEWAGNLFYGLSLGSVLLLAALGLAITFGLMGVINMAHGELMAMGAYTTYLVSVAFQHWAPGWMDVYLFVAIPLAFLVTSAFGYLLERGFIRWFYNRPLDTLLATWGLSLILQQTYRSIFGAQEVSVPLASWLSGAWEPTPDLQFPLNRIFILGLTLLVALGVYLLLYRSAWGLRVRAVTQNRAMAGAVGINTRRVDALTFALGSGLAGIAGCVFTMIGSTNPGTGQLYIVDSFIVVVFGGVQSLLGTAFSGLAIAQSQTTLEYLMSGSMAKVTILVLVIAVLYFRPNGLFATKTRG